jgi:hypothetical protein
MAHSLLLTPVPELDSVVRPRLERCSPELLPVDPDEPVAHITLLDPFADLGEIDDGMVSELRSFFADVLPFAFRLTSICQFPDGPTYLSADPAGPFRQLTHELFKRFPECPPYGGAFDDVVPHLSVPIPEGEDVDKLRFELESRLPISAHAREAALYWSAPGASHTLETFSFGTAAA